MHLINKDCIIFNITAISKNEAIELLVDHLGKCGAIANNQDFYNDVLYREKICTTVIGYDMAIPHGRTNNVIKTAICFGRLKKPVIWDEQTGKLAKYIILIAVPKQDSKATHMKIISDLARKLMHHEYREILSNGSQQEIYEFLNAIIPI